MEQCKLNRISELTAISRTRELTEEECCERQTLREEYLNEWRQGTKNALGGVYIMDENGKKRKLIK